MREIDEVFKTFLIVREDRNAIFTTKTGIRVRSNVKSDKKTTEEEVQKCVRDYRPEKMGYNVWKYLKMDIYL